MMIDDADYTVEGYGDKGNGGGDYDPNDGNRVSNTIVSYDQSFNHHDF